MRFYSVHFYSGVDGSFGYEWFTARIDAEQASRQAVRADPDRYSDGPPEIAEVDIEPTKAGILEALREHASHPNNG